MRKRQVIDYNKICANALFAFFSALIAANIAGAGFYSIGIALVNALIMAGLAGSTEFKKEAEGGETTNTKIAGNFMLF